MRASTVLFVFAAAFAVGYAARFSSVVDCGGADAAFDLHNYTISPDPVVFGSPVRIAFGGVLSTHYPLSLIALSLFAISCDLYFSVSFSLFSFFVSMFRSSPRHFVARVLTNGTMADVTIALNGQVLYDETVDVCAQAPDYCPIQPQTINVDQTVNVPAVPLPRATVKVTVRATDQDGREALCLDVNVDLVRGEEDDE